MRRLYNCLYCEQECETRDKRSKICKKLECRRLLSQDVYKLTLFDKVCKTCKNPFKGKLGETNCTECKGIVNFNWKSYERKIYCKYCDTLIKTVNKKLTGCTLVNKNLYRVCSTCKINITNKKISESHKGNKNPNWIGGYSHKKYQSIETEEQKKIRLKRFSDRMKINNPMKNPEISKKVTETKRRNKSFNYKQGKVHHLYKGNSKRSCLIRTRLYRTWILPTLERDKFSCTKCFKTKCRLEVHHMEPFRLIIEKHLTNFNKSKLDDLNENEFQLISDQIVEYHKNVEGKTVCHECHKLIDEYRK